MQVDMKLHHTSVTTLCLMFVVIVYSQTEQTTSESSRDYLFVKPRNFVRQQADKNKTRFTDEEKLMILQIHNSYRSVVLPSPANMRELIWDTDLEEYAWNHTQSCTGAHSQGTMVKKWNSYYWETWMYMGENLYYSYAPWYSLEEALWMFWAEGEFYNIAKKNCSGPQCGHYEVLVTANSSRIGCAMNTCDKFSVSKYKTPAIFISCSYNGRHLVYDRPYIVGERGSYCTYDLLGSDFEICRYGLCTNRALYRSNSGFDGNTSIVGLPPIYLTSTTTSTISSTFASETTTITTGYLNTTSEEYTTAETTASSTVTTRSTTAVENFTASSSSSYTSTAYTNTTEASTTLSTPSTEIITTLSTPSTESITTFSTPSTEIITTLSTHSTESTTQVEVVTSTQPSTSTKQTSSKRTVSRAARLCVWVSPLILLSLLYTVVSFH